jgi:hypothetical protein
VGIDSQDGVMLTSVTMALAWLPGSADAIVGLAVAAVIAILAVL